MNKFFFHCSNRKKTDNFGWNNDNPNWFFFHQIKLKSAWFWLWVIYLFRFEFLFSLPSALNANFNEKPFFSRLFLFLFFSNKDWRTCHSIFCLFSFKEGWQYIFRLTAKDIVFMIAPFIQVGGSIRNAYTFRFTSDYRTFNQKKGLQISHTLNDLPVLHHTQNQANLMQKETIPYAQHNIKCY